MKEKAIHLKPEDIEIILDAVNTSDLAISNAMTSNKRKLSDEQLAEEIIKHDGYITDIAKKHKFNLMYLNEKIRNTPLLKATKAAVEFSKYETVLKQIEEKVREKKTSLTEKWKYIKYIETRQLGYNRDLVPKIEIEIKQ